MLWSAIKGGKILIHLAKYSWSCRQLKLYTAEYFLLQAGFIDYVAHEPEILSVVQFKAKEKLMWSNCYPSTAKSKPST